MGKQEAIGPENDRHIIEAASFARFTICAWGNHGALFGRASEVLNMLRDRGVKSSALKVNAKSGQPAHPLYLKGNARPVGYPLDSRGHG